MLGRRSERNAAPTDWARIVLIVAIGVLGLGLADVLLPARSDWFGTSRVIAPFLALLFLPLLVIAAVVRGRTGRLLSLIAVAGLALGAMRFLTGFPSGPVTAPPDTVAVDVATWNVYLGTVPPEQLTDALVARAPAVIALEELTTSAAAAIEADPAIRAAYPYRVLHPQVDWSGMGLLSAWPIEGDPAADTMPPLIDARVAVPGAAPLAVIAAHAPPPIWRPSLAGPAYDPGLRDAALVRLRERVDAHVAAGVSYRAVGTGFGTTWRPAVASAPLLPFGLLRIDLVFTGPGATPIRSEPDCAARTSDHCILDVTLALPAAPSDTADS